MTRVQTTGAILLSALTAACSSSIHFRNSVDSIAREDAQTKRKFVLLPGSDDLDGESLEFLEFASYVEQLLTGRGFVKVDAFEEAEVAVFLTYAIGDPQTYQYAYSVPIWGQTTPSSSRTSGSISSYRSSANYSSRTTYSPTYGVVGSSSYAGSYTIYSRFLVLDAYDVPAYLATAEMKQVWRTSVVSPGASSDLRLVVPYMVAAMRPYVATHTFRRVDVLVAAEDPSVARMRAAARGRP